MSDVAIPAEFTEWTKTESDSAIAVRMNVSRGTVRRIREKLGIVARFPRGVPAKIDMPANFVEYARRESNPALALRFGVSEKRIRTWRSHAGVTGSNALGKSAASRQPNSIVPAIAPGVAGAAAQFLRSYYAPVYDRVIEDRKLKGEYVVGREKLSMAEMIERAREKGFNASAIF